MSGCPTRIDAVTQAPENICLPHDILCIIFEHYISHWEAAPIPDWSTLSRDLQAMMATSNGWRHAAMHTPRLWRNVLHRTDPGVPRHLAAGISRRDFRTSLAYTKYVQVNIWAIGYAAFMEIMQYIVEVGGLGRVQAIHLHNPDSANKHSANKCLSSLLRFDLQYIRALTLDCRNVSYETFTSTLRHVDNLRSLRITDAALQPADLPSSLPAVVLPELDTLYLADYRKDHMEVVFALLNAPKLDRLFLIMWRESERYYTSFRVPDGAFRSLRALTIGGSMSVRDIASFLRHTSNVEVLEISKVDGALTNEEGSLVVQLQEWDRLFEELETPGMEEDRNAFLLPHLRTLALHCIPVTLEAFLRFVRSRIHSSACRLESIGVGTISTLSETDIGSLAAEVTVFRWSPPDIDIRYAKHGWAWMTAGREDLAGDE